MPTSAMSSSRLPEASGSEDEFLAREMDAAKEAVLNTLGALKTDLAQATDVRAWTREHPWAAVGAAAAAGFLAAAAIKSAMGPSEPDSPELRAAVATPEPASKPQRRQAPLWIGGLTWLMEPLTELAKVWALRTFQNGVSPASVPEQPAPADHA